MKRFIAVFAAALLAVTALADEGMWMVNAIGKALEANMKERGLLLNAKEIYNADAPGAALADAVVSLDFGCTGSVISNRGLVITNHHCAYSDVHALSTAEHNYLEDGFWAMTDAEEIPIPGKHIQFLKKVIDVTEEAQALSDAQQLEGKAMGFRRLSYLMEKKYQEETGLIASLNSMWSGSKYYMALYEEYSDIRLVAAPPVSIAAFGGDIDNWEWPQHKCDFALYRIYTAPDGKPAEYSPQNVPLKPTRVLEVSAQGIKVGDFTMVIGYPGRTSRYSSSSKIRYEKDVTLPIANEIRRRQMDIITKWMNADEAVRLKYADRFFSLSNFQELQDGEVMCINRFGVVDSVKQQERQLQKWIEADPERKKELGNLLSELDRTYTAIAPAERSLAFYRETLIRGIRPRMIATRVNNLVRGKSAAEQAPFNRKALGEHLQEMDLRVEKELWRYNAEVYMENVDSCFWTSGQKMAYEVYGKNYDAMCENLWNNSWITDFESLKKYAETDALPDEKMFQDTLYLFLMENKMPAFNAAVDAAAAGDNVTNLGRKYTRALYKMREQAGVPQYPDANSTMRITYGTVGGYSPRDGVTYGWISTPAGLLEKHDPAQYDFCLKNDWKHLLEVGMPPSGVDFLTDNDITGGNSGSPVMNARGQLIGLAFDGNKESLASDVYYTPGYNKCVCVDIRFVLWTLQRYARMDRILEEITVK